MQSTIERLNENVSKKEFQQLINSLHRGGFRFCNLWEIINQFENQDDLRLRIKYNVRHDLIEGALKISKKLLKARKRKQEAISNLQYGEAKLYFEKEYKFKVKLMKYLREGNLKTYYLSCDYVIDVFEPSLMKLEGAAG